MSSSLNSPKKSKTSASSPLPSGTSSHTCKNTTHINKLHYHNQWIYMYDQPYWLRLTNDLWAKRAKWRAWGVLPMTCTTEASKSCWPSDTNCLLGLSSEKVEYAWAPAMKIVSKTASDECRVFAIVVSLFEIRMYKFCWLITTWYLAL